MVDARRRSPFKGLTLKLPRGTVPPPPDSLPAAPYDETITLVDAVDTPPRTDLSNRGEPTFRDDTSGLEIAFVREDVSAKGSRSIWRAVEVWTKNRVYGMDSSYICFEVIDRATGQLDPTHAILGGKLGGGRRRTGKGATFTHPLPVPGTEAMFLRAKKQGYTSPVERVVLRIHAVRVRHSQVWENVVEVGREDDDES